MSAHIRVETVDDGEPGGSDLTIVEGSRGPWRIVSGRQSVRVVIEVHESKLFAALQALADALGHVVVPKLADDQMSTATDQERVQVVAIRDGDGADAALRVENPLELVADGGDDIRVDIEGAVAVDKSIVLGHEDLPAVDGQVLVTPDAVEKTVGQPTDTRPCGRVGESAGGVKFLPALEGIEFTPGREARRTALGLLVKACNALEARAGTNDIATVSFGPEAGDAA